MEAVGSSSLLIMDSHVDAAKAKCSNSNSSSSSSNSSAKSSASSNGTNNASNRFAGVVQKYKVFEKLKKLSGGALFSGPLPGQLYITQYLHSISAKTMNRNYWGTNGPKNFVKLHQKNPSACTFEKMSHGTGAV